MMLFEIISRKRNLKQTAEPSTEAFFPVLVARKLLEGEVASLLGSELLLLLGDVSLEEFDRACKVACWCIQDSESSRPTMAEVVQMLEGLLAGAPPRRAPVPPEPGAAAVYNVVRYGARGDGAADSTQPFLLAWADACRSTSPAMVYVPPGRYLVGSATFAGPCGSRAVTFYNAGTVVAPDGYGWDGATGRWITFESVEGLTVTGGTLDGRGEALWACKQNQPPGGCPTGASSLTIWNSRDVVVDGVRSVSSELFHVVVMQCRGVNVHSVGLDFGVAPNPLNCCSFSQRT
ncbi:hypothetical protein GUJ93_ZPchr0001g30861 [Zizania palustris]|uniref:Polygalacturonase n=1 Tax=Zizania palustris TaxID=103762 RepID=A0A8J5RTW3_ZIZPA|nr:hypothetical protein GUJ93_ZPchr0001g30861 [Zizania palustris]